MKVLVAIVTLILTTGCLYAQVSNVRVQQRTDGNFMVDIYYDFSNPDGYDTRIMFLASDDNGTTWDLVCASLTGDVGEGITPSTDKHIVWDFYADNPNMSGSQFKVCVLYSFYSTMTGNDGTVYKTVKIDDQWWMAENLRETQYRDGTSIKEIADSFYWPLGYSGRCAYDNVESNADTYGYLYNWYACDDDHQIAPPGWHMPTDSDWKELERSLGMSESNVNATYRPGSREGSKLAGRADLWWGGGLLETDANFDVSGFCAVPGGYRNYDYEGDFTQKNYKARFWTASEEDEIHIYDPSYAWYRGLDHTNAYLHRSYTYKEHGFSIRLVKD